MKHNLKPLVNNKDLYEDFLVEIKLRIKNAQKALEQHNDIEDMYRAQGSIRELRKLLNLREQVNNDAR